MKIMYFIFEGFDTANGTNHLALTTIQTFLDCGMDVYLVTSHSKGLFPDIPEVISTRKGFSYSLIKRNKVEKKNFLQRYLDGISYSIKAYKEWRKYQSDIDIVVLQSTPTVFFSTFLLKYFMKKPIVFNSFDVFPDGPYFFGAIKNRTIYKILLFMQNFVYRSSDKIVVISDDMKQTILRKGIKESRLATIPNWYDSNIIREIDNENNQFIKKFNINRNKFIVQYAGNFGFTFNYQAVIEVAKILKNHSEIEFHMIGTGGFEKDFKNDVRKLGLNNIKFFPWQEADIISDVYSACDIEFVPLSRGVIWTSFPSKCTLLMACGRTFLCMCEKQSQFYSFVNKNKIGICTSRTDYHEAAEQILKLSRDRERQWLLENNAKKCGNKYYSSEVNVEKYVEIIRELVRG